MLGRATQPAVDDSSAKEHVEKIFNVSNLAQLSSADISPSILRNVPMDFFPFRFMMLIKKDHTNIVSIFQQLIKKRFYIFSFNQFIYSKYCFHEGIHNVKRRFFRQR